MINLLLIFSHSLVWSYSSGEPLYLTPLITSGKIEEAQGQAKIIHPQFLGFDCYSGYFTVNKSLDSQVFFWYLPADTEVDNNAPLLLWNSGNLGQSAMISMFQIGPYVPSSPASLRLNECTLHKQVNLLVLDVPVGVGYSTSSANNEKSVNILEDYYEALRQFYLLFPTTATKEFYIGGELFGSHSMLKLGNHIHEKNQEIYNRNLTKIKNVLKKKVDISSINLKGFIFLRGMFDLSKQMNFADYWFQTGIIDEKQKEIIELEESKMQAFINSGEYRLAYKSLSDIVLGSKDITPYNSLLINFTGSPQIVDSATTESRTMLNDLILFLNKDDVKVALHAANVTFMEYSPTVTNLLIPNAAVDLTEFVKKLLPNYRFLSLNIQLDPLCPAVFMDRYWNNINITELSKYRETKKEWFNINDESAGHYKHVNNLYQVYLRKDNKHLQQWTMKVMLHFINNYDSF